MSTTWTRPHYTMTFDALIDHILTEHEDWLRERFKVLIRTIEDLGEKVGQEQLEELAETYAHEIGYPLSDEPDDSLVDCKLCRDGAA
ncbi:hypothetical protein LCGC14_0485870 [marine sediment metagenome]|uniref:Uncharacterized protein n=1 Tax=marine sediment metagenome TaxID=412755 RepID=A0A0F9S7Z0_9ZZZZ